MTKITEYIFDFLHPILMIVIKGSFLELITTLIKPEDIKYLSKTTLLNKFSFIFTLEPITSLI